MAWQLHHSREDGGKMSRVKLIGELISVTKHPRDNYVEVIIDVDDGLQSRDHQNKKFFYLIIMLSISIFFGISSYLVIKWGII